MRFCFSDIQSDWPDELVPRQTVTEWLYDLAAGAEVQRKISTALGGAGEHTDWEAAAKHLAYARKCDKAMVVFLEAAKLIEELGLVNPEIVPQKSTQAGC